MFVKNADLVNTIKAVQFVLMSKSHADKRTK